MGENKQNLDRNSSGVVKGPSSHTLTSKIVAVTVGKLKTFYLHSDILITKSEVFSKNLTGGFKEASANAIEMEDEDPEIFGFFVEYLYRDCSIFSRPVQHYSELSTLARLYAMGERLMAHKFQSYTLWKFTESLTSHAISEEIVCDLLEIACNDITERENEDPMRAQIFWYAATNIEKLQKSAMFHQYLNEIGDLGKYLCLWIGKSRPPKASKPNEANDEHFAPESVYSLQSSRGVTKVEIDAN